MQLCMRWFNSTDPVPLEYIAQIPKMRGVVTALHDVPAREPWTEEKLGAAVERVRSCGLSILAIESIPVPDEIKLQAAGYEGLTEVWCHNLELVGKFGIPVVCYNWMLIFDWFRTALALPLSDGSNALAFDQAALATFDLAEGSGALPGWSGCYTGAQLRALIAACSGITHEDLWNSLKCFLKRAAPLAAARGVRLAIHPDDPPWPIFGLPRIMSRASDVERLLGLIESSANGITLCTGSFGADPDNDLVQMVERFAQRIHFAHCRNVVWQGVRSFHESRHAEGSLDLRAVLAALKRRGFCGPLRPDHGRMIWGEQGRPGYGLYDRALGAMWLQGVWDGLS